MSRLSIEELIQIAKFQSPTNYLYMKQFLKEKGQERYIAQVTCMPKSHILTFHLGSLEDFGYDSLNFAFTLNGLTIATRKLIPLEIPTYRYNCRFETRDLSSNIVLAEKVILSQRDFFNEINTSYSSKPLKWVIVRKLEKSRKKYSMNELIS